MEEEEKQVVYKKSSGPMSLKGVVAVDAIQRLPPPPAPMAGGTLRCWPASGHLTGPSPYLLSTCAFVLRDHCILCNHGKWLAITGTR